jgi:hypothetical protein
VLGPHQQGDQEFYSGKDETTPENRHRLPGVTDEAPSPQKARQPHPRADPQARPQGQEGRCHSDNVADADEAKLVQLNTLKALNESGL